MSESRYMELQEKTQQLLHGSLKHVRVAALAAVLVPLASVAAVSPAAAQYCPSGGCGPSCTIPATSETISSTSWNQFNVPMGTEPVVWVHAQFKPGGIPTTTTTTVQFIGVSFVLNGISYPMPNGTVIFDPAAPSTSTTTFTGTPGTSSALWTTTVNPNNISDENFFFGAAIPVAFDPNITGGGQATIQFTTQTSDTGLSFSWQWSAAVYTYWPQDWNAALIQPYHGHGLTGSQHADTPDNTQIQKSLVQGPRGGGGSNFTGSWSATGQGACQ
jgi:hypothetical protein